MINYLINHLCIHLGLWQFLQIMPSDGLALHHGLNVKHQSNKAQLPRGVHLGPSELLGNTEAILEARY